MSPPRPLLVLVGPTASGKTELAVRLAEALGGEIVSADSVQVYRAFDIGSGKPSAEELARAPHHLIDVVEPDELLEASRYQELAEAAIEDVRARGRVPLVCGGSFLWVRALLHGLAEAPGGDEAIRARHKVWAEAEGRAALHAALAQVDPASAARLHPNDFVRVSRALEVHELTGRPLSEVQAAHGFRTARYDTQLLGVGWPRELYDERVARRVRGMLDRGWIQEVEALIERGHGQARAMGAVGYKQIRDALTESRARGAARLDEDALHLEITRVTRVFARRQRTWLREEPVEWIDPTILENGAGFDELLERARAFLDGRGFGAAR